MYFKERRRSKMNDKNMIDIILYSIGNIINIIFMFVFIQYFFSDDWGSLTRSIEWFLYYIFLGCLCRVILLCLYFSCHARNYRGKNE